MQFVISVENIKCGGCARTIETSLLKLAGVTQVMVDIEQGQIQIEGEAFDSTEVAQKLLSLGYPEKGSVEGLASLTAMGKSFVSCAIGRFTPDKTAS